MSSLRNILASNVKNIIRGTRVPEKMIIFESDDWGSNRIASTEDFKSLVESGILKDDCSTYDRCDTIARPSDLENLFEILSSVKDKNGQHAKITPFFNPVNPDFSRIKDANFQKYYYEDFVVTLNKEGYGDKVLQLWKEAINNGMVSIAYHGREHVCFPLWMNFLQKGDNRVLEAFNHNFYAVPNVEGLTNNAKAFRPALYFENNIQKEIIKESLVDGIQLLTKLFDTHISVFAPPNGVSCSEFDGALSQNGIKLIHNTSRFEPDGFGSGKKVSIKRNEYGQKYYNRTCAFEPVHSNDAIDTCMCQIQGAFNWKKPAIISTHRVNYIGHIDARNKDKGLSQLQQLLEMIIKKWPDVVFATSNDYAEIILKD